MTYSGTDGRIMSGHDDAGKAASVSMLTPAGITGGGRAYHAGEHHVAGPIPSWLPFQVTSKVVSIGNGVRKTIAPI
jgi:hypothetical protein